MNKHNTKYAGFDLGDKTMMVHVRDEVGEFVEGTCLPTTAVVQPPNNTHLTLHYLPHSLGRDDKSTFPSPSITLAQKT